MTRFQFFDEGVVEAVLDVGEIILRNHAEIGEEFANGDHEGAEGIVGSEDGVEGVVAFHLRFKGHLFFGNAFSFLGVPFHSDLLP